MIKNIIFLVILKAFACQSVIGQTCNSSLDCISTNNSTLCCRNAKCVHEDVCTSVTKASYIASGVIGISLILLVTIYFTYRLKNLKKSVNLVKKEAEKDK